MRADRDDPAGDDCSPQGVAGNRVTRRARLLLGLAALLCVSAPLGALDAATGVYAGASLGWGGLFLLPYEQYRYDVQRFDTHGGQETNLLAPLPDQVRHGYRLGYRTEIAALELVMSFSHPEVLWLDYEVDGEPFELEQQPSTFEAGITGRFYALDIHGRIHPYLGFSLLFRSIKQCLGSIQWGGMSYTTATAMFWGYGYGFAVGTDIGVFRWLWLTLAASCGWHRYLWVYGALGDPTALADSIQGVSWSISASAAVLLIETPKRPRRR